MGVEMEDEDLLDQPSAAEFSSLVELETELLWRRLAQKDPPPSKYDPSATKVGTVDSFYLILL